MADSSNELTVPKPDAGMAFRMEMWATNALLGYWWVLVGIIVAVLYLSLFLLLRPFKRDDVNALLQDIGEIDAPPATASGRRTHK